MKIGEAIRRAVARTAPEQIWEAQVDRGPAARAARIAQWRAAITARWEERNRTRKKERAS